MMKKLKKMLALIMAVASIMSLSVFTTSTFAVNDSSTKVGAVRDASSADDPLTSVTVYKDVTVSNGVKLPTEKFYVQMVPATADEISGATVGSISVKPGLALTTSVQEFTFDANDNTAAGYVEKSATFSLTDFANSAKFTSSGIYRYYIREVIKNSDNTYTAISADNKAGAYITYDDTLYTVDVYVDADSEGNYVVTHVVTTDGTKDADTGADVKPSYISFNNEISSSTIQIKKFISRNTTEYQAGEQYKFWILIPEEGDTIALAGGSTDSSVQAQKYTCTGTDAQGNPTYTTVEISIPIPDDTDITSDVKTYGYEFTLGANDYLEIYAPVSMIYKVVEDDYSDEDYTTTVQYTADGNYALSADQISARGGKYIADGEISYEYTDTEGTKTCVGVKGTTNYRSNQVIFTNTREVTVPNGVSVDVLPYAVVVAVAAAGCVLFLVKKNRETR